MTYISIDRMKRIEKKVKTKHDEVNCTYSIIQLETGEKLIQIDTYGSSSRQIKNKISQTMQFDKSVLNKLTNELVEEDTVNENVANYHIGNIREKHTEYKNEIIYFNDKEIQVFRELMKSLERKGNAILYGPPGTGKTYLANRYLRWCKNNGDDLETQFCTFHPNFSYEDFIEGYKPTTNQNGETYFELKEGIFKKIVNEAKSNREKKYYLVIDEINRGNIEKIFGEMITLIEKDKRGEKLILSQSSEQFYVPKNLFIIGTMNTSDKSIRLIDAAIRRRFAFIECMTNYLVLNKYVPKIRPSLGKILKDINSVLREYEGRDKQIGQAYLMKDSKPINDLVDLKDAFLYDIFPLISEYCFNDYKRIGEILGQDFIDEKNEIINEKVINNDEFFIEALNKKFGGNDD